MSIKGRGRTFSNATFQPDRTGTNNGTYTQNVGAPNGTVTRDGMFHPGRKPREATMAELTTKHRNALPKSTFAGPDRSYPIPDKSHAANAKGRAKQALDAGRISQSTYDHIVAQANHKLKE